ncbi:hypothetical protein DYBT9275_00414 [Dyadobacter sp. CECT 9275]|uniref:Uncharacterized protein n=1 Tax=Dyadobacter helix TaxID=2822344 RepID=A0A916J7Y5_9BACT|nr:hypothetical protein DYBT9275_00414 [Dyadobacter sp. CECT 9275]
MDLTRKLWIKEGETHKEKVRTADRSFSRLPVTISHILPSRYYLKGLVQASYSTFPVYRDNISLLCMVNNRMYPLGT